MDLRWLIFLLLSPAAFGQQPIVNIAGIWEFTFKSFPSATVQIKQTAVQLWGEFMFSGATAPIPFTGTMSTLFNIGVNLRTPDANGGTISYSGGVAADGNLMSGTSTNGNWIAKRLAGFGAPTIIAVTNAASGAVGAVSPGEIISLFANAPTNPIGPAVGVGVQIDPSGKVATAAGGVRLRFLPIDVYAPLTYTGPGQINAVVPYEVAGLSAVDVQVEYLNRPSNTFRLSVAPTAPGIFTANGSGVGQGAILNDDGTANGPIRPQRRGGVAVLYMTGQGQTNPPGVSGRITTVSETSPLTPQPMARVEVRINGQSAPVLFSGEAPGLVSGVMQLNVQIPMTISPGRVPVQAFFSGVPSQEGVTVMVE
jgi:uncharacterized protein (TIGR03437 family)